MNAYLPESGTRSVFKRALIHYFCSPMAVGQRWVLYYRNVPAQMTQKEVTVREISGSRVHFTYLDDIGTNMTTEQWGWLTEAEFVSRRVEGTCVRAR